MEVAGTGGETAGGEGVRGKKSCGPRQAVS